MNTDSLPTPAREASVRLTLLLFSSSHQSDADQLRRQNLPCSWTSSMELSADGHQTFRTAGDVFIRAVGPQRSVNLAYLLITANKIRVHFTFITRLLVTVFSDDMCNRAPGWAFIHSFIHVLCKTVDRQQLRTISIIKNETNRCV